MADIGATAAGLFGFDGFGTIVQTLGTGLFVGAILVGIVWYYLEQKKYNKSVKLRRVHAGNKGPIFMDKAKRWKDKEGVVWWKLRSLKKVTSVPPDSALEVTSTGKTFVQGVIDSNDQITWIEDTFDYESYKKGNPAYKAVSTESKANYAYQMRYNKKLRVENWKENLPAIAGGITLVMIVAIALMMTPKVIEANTELAEENARVASQQASTMGQMNDLLENINYFMQQQGVSPPPPEEVAPQ